MSRRTPAELSWHEHSKPPIQKERKSRLPGIMGRLMIFVRNHILLPLMVHEALAPLPFHLEIALGARTAGSERDMLDRELRSPVRIEQSVRLLIGVGELCIAEARQHRQGADYLQQVEITL